MIRWRANLDIIQPNITSCGGYTQGLRIAALATAANRPISCHNTNPTLATAAHLHLWAVAPACVDQQEYFGEDGHTLLERCPVLADPPKVVAGAIDVPNGPGLGVEVDEDTVRAAARDER